MEATARRALETASFCDLSAAALRSYVMADQLDFDFDKAATMFSALQDALRDGASLAVSSAVNLKLIRREMHLHGSRLPDDVKRACRTSSINHQAVFGPEASQAIQDYRASARSFASATQQRRSSSTRNQHFRQETQRRRSAPGAGSTTRGRGRGRGRASARYARGDRQDARHQPSSAPNPSSK